MGVLQIEPASRKFSREVGGRKVGAHDTPQGVLPQNWGGTEQNCTATCKGEKEEELKATANDRRTTSPLPR
ncbi:hypothetical protein TNCV_4531171 [Trichonephila clavipes]|nr:hypothetical protein TNCV_4531171 [Trichonephila clavipes]